MIYTYLVDHGKDAPRVGAQTDVNGGKLQAVMFDDAFARLDAAEEERDYYRDLAHRWGDGLAARGTITRAQFESEMKFAPKGDAQRKANSAQGPASR